MDAAVRVGKKLITPFESCGATAAVLMVNLFDPQVTTTKLFLDAIKQQNLPYLIVGNKMDLVSNQVILNTESELGSTVFPVSFLTGQNTADLEGVINNTFSPDARISVLGIFNTGKTSLIANLTRKQLKISNLPGTTLEFEEHHWGNRVLIDSVGQLIDVNRPLMVGYDFSGLTEPEQMMEHALRQEAEGILSSLASVREGFISAVNAIVECITRDAKIVVIGAGASGLVAEEIAGQFFETGVISFPITNSLSQAFPVSFAKGIGEEEGGVARYIARSVEPTDLLIGVSASGGTGFVYEALRLARAKGVKTIALTENRDTPLGEHADIVIKSNAKPEGPSSTRIQSAHLAIGHALVCVVAAMRGLTGEESVKYMLSEHLDTKKMGIK